MTIYMKRILFIVVALIVSVVMFGQREHVTRRAGHITQERNVIRGNVVKKTPPDMYHCAASPEDVQLMLTAIKGQNFEDKKLELAIVFVRIKPVTVEGLRTLVEAFNFDDSRLEFLKQAYTMCPNKERYFTLYDVFSFQTNGDKLLEYIGLERY